MGFNKLLRTLITKMKNFQESKSEFLTHFLLIKLFEYCRKGKICYLGLRFVQKKQTNEICNIDRNSDLKGNLICSKWTADYFFHQVV